MSTKNKLVKKIFYGSILLIIYGAFFISVEAGQKIGMIPLIAITLFWAWAFYKTTGIDIGLFPNNKIEPKNERPQDNQTPL